MKSSTRTRTLTECALMIALATVLGFIPLYELPRGGSITLLSMLPIVAASFRCGPRWGALTAFVHGVIQLGLGLKNLSYCQSFAAAAGCVLLDYLLAFTLLGLACLVGKPFKNIYVSVGVGTLVVCLGRYLCSFFSGYLVWRDYQTAFSWMTEFGWGQRIAAMGENALCWLYSAVYNATYMLPETLLTVVAAVLLLPRLLKKRQPAAAED